MKFPRIEKDTFVIDTNQTFAKFGDYLVTVDAALESSKQTGLNEIMAAFGQSGRLISKEARILFNAHRKRFILRYGWI